MWQGMVAGMVAGYGVDGLERGVLLSLHSVSQSGLIYTELSAMEPALSLSESWRRQVNHAGSPIG